MSLIKNLFTVLFIAILASCASTSTYERPVPDEMKRANQTWCNGTEFSAMGGNECFIDTKKEDFEILADVRISDLRIRHSRIISGKFALNCDKGNLEILEFFGPFNSFTTKSAEKILSKVQTCTIGPDSNIPVVHLSSGGGNLLSGMAVGRLIKKYGFRTYIPNGAMCASSCGIAFFGGKFRSMGFKSTLLLHAPYLEKDLPPNLKYTLKLLEMENEGITCVTEMPELKDYFVEMLGEESGIFLYAQTMEFCDTSNGWVFNNEAAELYEIVNDQDYVNPLAKYYEILAKKATP